MNFVIGREGNRRLLFSVLCGSCSVLCFESIDKVSSACDPDGAATIIEGKRSSCQKKSGVIQFFRKQVGGRSSLKFLFELSCKINGVIPHFSANALECIRKCEEIVDFLQTSVFEFGVFQRRILCLKINITDQLCYKNTFKVFSFGSYVGRQESTEKFFKKSDFRITELKAYESIPPKCFVEFGIEKITRFFEQ